MKILINPYHVVTIGIKVPKNAKSVVPDFEASGPLDVLLLPVDLHPETTGYRKLSSKKMDEIFETLNVKHGRNIVKTSMAMGVYLGCDINSIDDKVDYKILFYNKTQENVIFQLNGWDYIYKSVKAEEPKEPVKNPSFWDRFKFWNRSK